MAETTLQLTATYVCVMCKKFIEEEVRALEGVAVVRTETETRQVTVEFDEGIVSEETIAEAALKYGCHVHCWYWTDRRFKRINIGFNV